jgi:hypothetical protein
MKFCYFCKCTLSIGEDLFCLTCMEDGRNLNRKLTLVREWKKNLEVKLLKVEKTIDSVEKKIQQMQGD